MPEWVFFVLLPSIDVLSEVGLASAFPHFQTLYGSASRASLFIAVNPLAAMLGGWLWGALARRFSFRAAFRLAALGWIIATLSLGFVLHRFEAALAARIAQGFFASGLTALSFVGITKSTRDKAAGSRRLGRLEAAATIGAVIGPATMGVGVTLAAPASFITVAALVALIVVAKELLSTPAALSPAGIKAPMDWTVLYRVLPSTGFAAAVGLILGALQTLIPSLSSPFAASMPVAIIGATMFQVLIVPGLILQSKRHRRGPGVPILVSVVLVLAFILSPFRIVVVGLVVFLGFLLGMGITMGNQLAASAVTGSEDMGMSIYSTLRIGGSFIGPLFMNIAYPGILLALATVSLLSAKLVVTYNR